MEYRKASIGIMGPSPISSAGATVVTTDSNDVWIAACDRGRSCRRRARSKVAALPLLLFDRDEKRFEVAFAERHAPAPLDDFEKDRRAVLQRFGENLQHVSLVVFVDQDAQIAQDAGCFIDASDARFECIVV